MLKKKKNIKVEDKVSVALDKQLKMKILLLMWLLTKQR